MRNTQSKQEARRDKKREDKFRNLDLEEVKMTPKLKSERGTKQTISF